MRNHRLLGACAFAFVAAAVCAPQAALAACTSTSFNIYTGYGSTGAAMTAALVNPAGNVSGDVDASGCDIGVYYGPGKHGHVANANIHGAKYFGVVNDGGRVEVESSSVSDIGDLTSGTSRGYGIFFWGGSNVALGSVHHSVVWRYQKNGIVIAGDHAYADVYSNSVLGEGQTMRIAQNGIEVIAGANASIYGNFVFGDAYTGSGGYGDQAAGILIYGGTCYTGVTVSLVTGVKVERNVVSDSDIGIALTNCTSPGVAVTTATRNVADNNTLVNNAVTSVTAPPYQAGIQAIGKSDTITDNDTCGPGYADNPPTTHAIDASLDTNAMVKHNTVCKLGHDRVHDHDHDF